MNKNAPPSRNCLKERIVFTGLRHDVCYPGGYDLRLGWLVHFVCCQALSWEKKESEQEIVE